MPIIIVKPLEVESDGTCLINVNYLDARYPQFCKQGIGIRSLVNRVYNPSRKVIKSPKIVEVFRIQRKETYYAAKLDLSPFALYEGIPKGYLIEILAINFIYEHKDKDTGKQTSVEFPIYPNELLTDVDDYEIKRKVQEDLENLQRVGQAFETIGLLYQTKLYDIASDLTDALIRFENNDYEGSIKFFRKVMEGLRNNIKDKVIVSENRTKEFRSFLNASYGLMSNFGEHAGTHGWANEAILCKDCLLYTSDAADE